MNNPWVTHRILAFFNAAEKATDITRRVLDNPTDGAGRGIGPALAKRILHKRDGLTFGRFTTREELDDVRGVGPNTWSDLEYTFGTPAAAFFEKSLFDKEVLFDNWTVLHYDWVAETQEDFTAVVQEEAAFRQVVRDLAERACAETAGLSPEASAAATEPLLQQYIDAYHNSTQEAALAFTLWWYRFAADNWFSFTEMLAGIDQLFHYHAQPLWDMELRLFKGFDNGVFTRLIAPPDLPVLVNFPEQTVTIWIAGLAD